MQPVDKHAPAAVERYLYSRSFRLSRKKRVEYDERVPRTLHTFGIERMQERRKRKLSRVFSVVIVEQFDPPPRAVAVDDDVRKAGARRTRDERVKRRRKSRLLSVILFV